MIIIAAEKSFEEKLKEWLESEGIYRLRTPEQKMTVEPCGYWEKRWGSKYSGAGWPDMHIVVNNISIEAELKVPGNSPSELQIQKLNQIDDSKCVGLVLYPKDFDNFKRLIRYIKTSAMDWREVATFSGLERGWRK